MDHDSLPSAPDVTDITTESGNRNDAVEYDPETDTYRASFDSATGSVTDAVISTVAVVSGTEPLELPPLYADVDPDSLEALIGSTASGPETADIHVSFGFYGCDVTVHSYGIIAVQPAPDGRDRSPGE